MSVSRKGRRRMIVDGKTFWWEVVRDYRGHEDSSALHVLSEDKKFEVFYALRQRHNRRPFLDIRRGVPAIPVEVQHSDCLLLRFPIDDSGSASPRLVRRIIEWCFDPNKHTQPVAIWMKRKSDDSDLFKVNDEFPNFRQVKRLFLLDSEITNVGFRQLTTLRAIEKLIVSGARITNEALTELSTMKALKSLGLSKASITDDGLKHIATLSALTYLGIEGSEVTDVGLHHLLPLRRLRILDVSNTDVTHAGIDEFFRLLRKGRSKAEKLSFRLGGTWVEA